MSTTNTQQATLVVRALESALGNGGTWSADDVEGDDLLYDGLPWGVLETDNDGRYWLAGVESRADAMLVAKRCVEQDSCYAWWPLAILNIQAMTFELVDVAITIATSEPEEAQA